MYKYDVVDGSCDKIDMKNYYFMQKINNLK